MINRQLFPAIRIADVLSAKNMTNLSSCQLISTKDHARPTETCPTNKPKNWPSVQKLLIILLLLLSPC